MYHKTIAAIQTRETWTRERGLKENRSGQNQEALLFGGAEKWSGSEEPGKYEKKARKY